MPEETGEMGKLVAGCEMAPLDDPAAPAPAPTVTVMVLANVTVIVAGPQVPLPEPPVTGELSLTGGFPLTGAIPPAEELAPAPPPETAPLLLTGRGETVTVEYMTCAVPVPVGPTEVAFS